MPAKFDRMVDKIRKSMKGKKNPRTGKLFTDGDIYAIATAAWKKTHGGKAPSREAVEDWHLLEFVTPIKEARMVGDEFIIKGVAVSETTSRNGIRYVADELSKAGDSWTGKPLLVDHRNEISALVGRVKESKFNPDTKAVDFSAVVMDESIREKINKNLIQDVSIGAAVQSLDEAEGEEGVRIARGISGMELSFVCVPGVVEQGISSFSAALENSFAIKERMEMAEEMVDELDLDDEKEEEQEETKEIIKEKIKYITSKPKITISYYT